MKRIYDMEDTEVLALTDEQISNLVDYECALEGVPLLPPEPGPAPVKVAPPLDLKVFEVGGVMVVDAEHAGRILDVITSGPIFKKEYDKEHLVPLNSGDYSFPKIETKMVRSIEQWEAIKADMTAYEAAKREYDKTSKLYNDITKDRQRIVNGIYDIIHDVRDLNWQREHIRSEFARYLVLAEGNPQIALNFLEKVKDLSKFPELKLEFVPEAVAPESAL